MRLFFIFKRLAMLVLVLGLSIIGGIFWWATTPLGFPESIVDFRVLPGSSVRQAVTQMNQAGLGIEPNLTLLGIRFVGIDNKLKAGTYSVKAGSSPLDVLTMLKNGDISLVELRFPEGWSLQQWLQYLANQADIEHDLVGLPTSEISKRIGINLQNPEGFFFPDTYKVDKHASDSEVLRKAYRIQQDKLMAAWKKRAPDLPYKTPYEALTMASIVEKETGRAEDRTRVAAVFVNRLRSGMRLQTDPTVIYGMGESFDGNIRKADLLRDTPYNTYTRSGLPPTPITMPGLASIEAALHPAEEDIYYFVARGDGSSQFSRTLAEHNAAVVRYQLKH
ncbi:MAG: hypothetical protein RIR18_912 [Pseudomonadota bacterium]